MAVYTIQGLRSYNFKADDGKQLTGTTVFCSFNDVHIEGTGTDHFSISSIKLGDIKLKIGMVIEPLYNKYGKVDAIRVV